MEKIRKCSKLLSEPVPSGEELESFADELYDDSSASGFELDDIWWEAEDSSNVASRNKVAAELIITLESALMKWRILSTVTKGYPMRDDGSVIDWGSYLTGKLGHQKCIVDCVDRLREASRWAWMSVAMTAVLTEAVLRSWKDGKDSHGYWQTYVECQPWGKELNWFSEVTEGSITPPNKKKLMEIQSLLDKLTSIRDSALIW